jgi:hypothetical protein
VIAISGLLVVIAFVTLIVGVFQSGLGMIYVSIAASVAAAVSLATGVVKSRPKAVAVTGPEPLGTWGGTATPVLDRPAEEAVEEELAPAEIAPAYDEEPSTAALRLDEPVEDEAEAEAPVAAAPAKSARSRAASSASKARKSASKTTATARGAAKKTASGSRGSVVVVPGRDKYHKEACRYVQGQVTQTITKAAAAREGYKACGVCKPG